MFEVQISTHNGLSIGRPRQLFERSDGVPTPTAPFYDVMPDGKSFVMLKEMTDTAQPTDVVVVQNWFEELNRRVPVQ